MRKPISNNDSNFITSVTNLRQMLLMNYLQNNMAMRWVKLNLEQR